MGQAVCREGQATGEKGEKKVAGKGSVVRVVPEPWW